MFDQRMLRQKCLSSQFLMSCISNLLSSKLIVRIIMDMDCGEFLSDHANKMYVIRSLHSIQFTIETRSWPYCGIFSVQRLGDNCRQLILTSHILYIQVQSGPLKVTLCFLSLGLVLAKPLLGFCVSPFN